MRPAPLLLLLVLPFARMAQPQSTVTYSHASGQVLTLEHLPAAGPGPHPAVLLIGGAGPDESCCADWLVRAGYSVFLVQTRPAPFPAPVDDVQRAIRFIRHQGAGWRIDSRRLALIGIGLGGYAANLAAVRPPVLGGKPAADPVDRLSARVSAVVSLSAWSDLRGAPPPAGLTGLLRPFIEARGSLEAALAEASPVMHIHAGAPPFLLIHGDADPVVPFVQSAHWQYALQAAGVSANLLLIRGGGHASAGWSRIAGVRNWEDETLEWLARALAAGGPARRGK